MQILISFDLIFLIVRLLSPLFVTIVPGRSFFSNECVCVDFGMHECVNACVVCVYIHMRLFVSVRVCVCVCTRVHHLCRNVAHVCEKTFVWMVFKCDLLQSVFVLTYLFVCLCLVWVFNFSRWSIVVVLFLCSAVLLALFLCVFFLCSDICVRFIRDYTVCF